MQCVPWSWSSCALTVGVFSRDCSSPSPWLCSPSARTSLALETGTSTTFCSTMCAFARVAVGTVNLARARWLCLDFLTAFVLLASSARQSNGTVLGIDFGVAFGAGAHTLPVPELLPFRYTATHLCRTGLSASVAVCLIQLRLRFLVAFDSHRLTRQFTNFLRPVNTVGMLKHHMVLSPSRARIGAAAECAPGQSRACCCDAVML